MLQGSSLTNYQVDAVVRVAFDLHPDDDHHAIMPLGDIIRLFNLYGTAVEKKRFWHLDHLNHYHHLCYLHTRVQHFLHPPLLAVASQRASGLAWG